MAPRWRSLAGGEYHKKHNAAATFSQSNDSLFERCAETTHMLSNSSDDQFSRRDADLNDFNEDADSKPSSQIAYAETGDANNDSNSFIGSNKRDVSSLRVPTMSFTRRSFVDGNGSPFACARSPPRHKEVEEFHSSQTDYDASLSGGLISSQGILWNSSADVMEAYSVCRQIDMDEKLQPRNIDDFANSHNANSSSRFSLSRTESLNRVALSKDDLSCRVNGDETGISSKFERESPEPKDCGSMIVEQRFLIPDSQETPADDSNASRLSNVNLSDLFCDSGHSNQNASSIARPFVPGALMAPIASSTQASDLSLQPTDDPSLSSLPSIPFRSNQQPEGDSLGSAMEQIPTSTPWAGTGSPPNSRRGHGLHFRKRVLSSPGLESPKIKKARTLAFRRSAEIDNNSVSVSYISRDAPFDRSIVSESLLTRLSVGRTEHPGPSLDNGPNHSSAPLSRSSQAISYLSMHLNQGLDADSEGIDVSYLSGIQKHEFLSTLRDEKGPHVAENGRVDGGTTRISQSSPRTKPPREEDQDVAHAHEAHVLPHSSLAKSKASLSELSPVLKAAIPIHNVPKVKLPPFCILLPSAPPRHEAANQPLSRHSVTSVDKICTGFTSPANIPVKSSTLVQFDDPATLGDFFALFHKTYPLHKISLKQFRSLCRKIASLATEEESEDGFPPEELYDAYVLEHARYDRLCLGWIQSGQAVVPYHSYLKAHPLQRGNSRAIITLSRLKRFGFC